MAWNTPKTWSTGNLVTATEFNQQLRDNLLYLKSPPKTIFLGMTTSQITSTSFVPLHETQNIITTTGGSVLFTAFGHIYKNGTTQNKAFINLEVDGNLVTGSSEGIVNGMQFSGDFQTTPWAIIWLTDTLTPAFHTFRLYGRVGGGGAYFWIGRISMVEI